MVTNHGVYIYTTYIHLGLDPNQEKQVTKSFVNTSVVAANVLALTVRQPVFGGNSLPDVSTTQINCTLVVKDVAAPLPLLLRL